MKVAYLKTLFSLSEPYKKIQRSFLIKETVFMGGMGRNFD
jgi:hypothetical protein